MTTTTAKRRRIPRVPCPGSELEALFLLHLAVAGLPVPEQQVRFAPPRRWRADFAWPRMTPPVLVEIDGGTWNGGRGRHTSGAGYERDCEKLNTASLMGWLVLRFTRAMIESGQAVQMVMRALGEDGKKGAA